MVTEAMGVGGSMDSRLMSSYGIDFGIEVDRRLLIPLFKHGKIY